MCLSCFLKISAKSSVLFLTVTHGDTQTQTRQRCTMHEMTSKTESHLINFSTLLQKCYIYYIICLKKSNVHHQSELRTFKHILPNCHWLYKQTVPPPNSHYWLSQLCCVEMLKQTEVWCLCRVWFNRHT